MKLTVLPFLLFLPGCFSEAFYVDSRFTPDEEAELRAGAALWEPTGLHRDLIFGARINDFEEDRNMVVRTGARGAAMIDPLFKERDSVSLCRHGALRPTKITIVMERVIYEPLSIVFAHELGHAMGLKHIGDPRAIMAPVSSDASLNCLTGADVGEACHRGDSCPEPRPVGCEVER